MNRQVDILWYGRGGQGAFSAAKLLGASYAFSGEGKHVLAFPSFGPERRGAPVRAYTKLSDSCVSDRSAVTVPDYAICLDSTLLPDFAGLQIKEGGFVLATTAEIEEFAVGYLGRPIVNTVLLALLCAQTGLLDATAIERGIEETLPPRIQAKNIELVRAAFDVASELLEPALSVPSTPQAGHEQAQPELPQASGAELGFEYMNLYTADAFNTPQRVYGVPQEGGER